MPPLTESEIIAKLKNEQFCLFFGAGISRGVGLPLGNELGCMILEALGVTRSEAEKLSKLYHLERMLFLMKNYLGESIHGAYSALSTKSYGTNHIILGSLLTQKSVPLLTTNQDLLIEEALGNTPMPLLFEKIHGTISDQQSLRITLDRVSSLDPNILNNLLQIVQNRIVIVIGYSFSDYDLKFFFETIRDRVYFLDYSGNGNTFLKDYLWHGDNAGYDKHRFISSAENFLEKLANELNVHYQQSGNQKISGVSGGAVSRVQNWASQYPDYLKQMAVSCLYQGMWQGEKTLTTMRNVSTDTSVPDLYRSLAFAEASRASEGTSSYVNQKKFIRDLRSLNLDIKFRDFIYHLNLAAFHHIHDNPVSWWRAYRNYNFSDLLLTQIQKTSSSSTLTDLTKKYQKNIHHGIASSIEKLNRVSLFRSKLPKALQLISPYTGNNIPCDLDFLCEALFIHGKLCIHNRDINQAESFYIRALEIAKWIKKDHSIDQALRGLAKINGLAGNFNVALDYLEESYEKAKNTDEPILKARNFLTRSWLHKRKSEKEKSKEFKRKGFNIYMQHRGTIQGFIDANFYMLAGR